VTRAREDQDGKREERRKRKRKTHIDHPPGCAQSRLALQKAERWRRPFCRTPYVALHAPPHPGPEGFVRASVVGSEVRARSPSCIASATNTAKFASCQKPPRGSSPQSPASASASCTTAPPHGRRGRRARGGPCAVRRRRRRGRQRRRVRAGGSGCRRFRGGRRGCEGYVDFLVYSIRI
jgi:hypothetical protein